MTSPRGRLGRWGEAQARLRLEATGYRLIATNYRSRWGEIDIVAGQGEQLVFVEVRTRRGTEFGSPEESVTAHKARRLIATAHHYLQSHSTPTEAANAAWRIDLICVYLDKTGKLERITHLENAIEG